jgi:hypothetical protein
MNQQLWGYKVEEKLYPRAREKKRLKTTGSDNRSGPITAPQSGPHIIISEMTPGSYNMGPEYCLLSENRNIVKKTNFSIL